MNLDIKGKVAVVTGADSGIGKETAKYLLNEGVTVIVSDLKQEGVDEAVSELKGFAPNGSVAGIAADLSKADSADSLAKTVEAQYGGADIIVNAAGIRGAAGDFLELTDEDWYKTIDVDLMAAVRVARAFIPQMRSKGWGRLVFVSSENALQPYPEESPYNACKAGIINLAKGLSKAYSPSGVLINTVLPAFIETPMTDAMMDELAQKNGYSREEAVKDFVKKERPGIAAQRRGKVEEVAAVIAFLCSEQASFVNGSAYRVDGGAVMTAFG